MDTEHLVPTVLMARRNGKLSYLSPEQSTPACLLVNPLEAIKRILAGKSVYVDMRTEYQNVFHALWVQIEICETASLNRTIQDTANRKREGKIEHVCALCKMWKVHEERCVHFESKLAATLNSPFWKELL